MDKKKIGLILLYIAWFGFVFILAVLLAGEVQDDICPTVTRQVQYIEKPVYLESNCKPCPEVNCVREIISKADEVKILEDYLK